MKVAVVGSRDYRNLADVRHITRALVANGHEIISGGARGVDRTAQEAAESMGVGAIVFAPDWSSRKHPNDFGPLFARNTRIVYAADKVLAFWDGESKGTLDTIRKAVKAGKVVVINPKPTIGGEIA